MTDFALRPAIEQDFPAIRELIHRVGINPMSLDWRRFIVAVDDDDRLLGCGQLKPHGKGIVELASLAVQPEHRGRGIARAIIEALLERAPRPLYLMCLAELGPFYEKWRFRSLAPDEMPAYFRRLAQIAGMLAPIAGQAGRLLVMELK